MNKKGVITSIYIFFILAVTIVIISIVYIPVVNSSFAVKRGGDKIIELVNERNALERMHGTILASPNLNETINYEDLGFQAVFESSAENVTTETVEAESSGGKTTALEFVLTNESTVIIEVDYVVAWNDGVQYPPGISRYSFELIHETFGKIDLGSVQTTNIVGATLLEIPSDSLPLGKYQLVVKPSRLDVSISTTYELRTGNKNVLQLLKDGVVVHEIYQN